MRFYCVLLCWLGSLATSFGQASSKQVLCYLKENIIKIPVDVPKGKYLEWKCYGFEGRRTPKSNELMIFPSELGEKTVSFTIDGKEVWKETFWIKRSTNVLYIHERNEILAECNLPTPAGVQFETDNGTVIRSARALYAAVYPTTVGKCTVIAKCQGKIVWQNVFEVRAIPSYTLYLGNAVGKELNLSMPLPTNVVVRVMVRADSTFSQSVRTYYRVTGATYILYRGNKAIQTGRTPDGSVPKPEALGARSGDRMSVQVERVQYFCPHCQIQETILPPISNFTFTIK